MAIGDCAAGCGVFAGDVGVGDGAVIEIGASIVVLGCPPTPAMIKTGLAQAAKALSAHFARPNDGREPGELDPLK